jgi:hypothetical protein
MAVVAAGLGRAEEALRRLGEARRLRSPRLRELRVSPVWDRLRDDPRFPR